jgi:2-hydroxy-6-oxonona-2,4-dienedioate hydrolase
MTTEIDELTTSRFVQTESWRLHYNEAGQGHPVILLHGSGPGATGWSNFQANIGPLSERYRVLAFDMPGWGQSDTITDESERDHAGALLEAMDALCIEKAALVGNSMGAMTSLTFAVRYPDRISHLIPMGGPAPGPNVFSPGGGLSEGLQILVGTYLDPSPENFKRLVSIMAYDQAFATDDLAEQRSKAALERPEHLQHFVPGLGSLRARFDAIAGQLEQIQTPTLVIHGRDDRTVSMENSLRLVSQIPNSRLVLFNRCGHWAQLEHSAEFNRLVGDFIANH